MSTKRRVISFGGGSARTGKVPRSDRITRSSVYGMDLYVNAPRMREVLGHVGAA